MPRKAGRAAKSVCQTFQFEADRALFCAAEGTGLPSLLADGGTGTASDPYLIYNAEQLQNIAKISVYQGSACKICFGFKLMVSVTSGDYRRVKDLTISDLSIAHLTPSGYNGIGGFVGGIAGLNYGQIYNCSVSGTIDVDMYNAGVGGIVGSAFTGTISYCESNVDIYGTGRLGGISGQINGEISVSNCINSGSINYKFNTQSGCAAGIVGRCINGVVNYNTNNGEIIYFGEKSDSSSIKPCMAQIVGWLQSGSETGNKTNGSTDFSKLTSSQATYCTNDAIGR